MLFRLLLLFLLTPLLAHAQHYAFHGPETHASSGIAIEIRSFYENVPPHGFLPAEIVVANNSNRDGTWKFFFASQSNWNNGDTVHHESVLSVPAGETKRARILVPLPTTRQQYRSINGRAEGPGITTTGQSFSLGGSYYSGNAFPASFGMTQSLADRNWGEMRGFIGHASSPVDLDLMPADWRGFSGLDQFWMTDLDWQKIGTAERAALLEWVALGHTLLLCRESGKTPPLPLLPELDSDKARVAIGYGHVHTWIRNGDALDSAAVTTHIQTHSTERQISDVHEGYRTSDWQPLDYLPPVRLRSGLFIGFLVLFALLVGPVNLYVFARDSRRYRLFWTTPVISLGASGFIFLLILFQDGTGGRGYQRAIWNHFPDRNKAVFIQEQVARTALLTGRKFETEHPAALYNISIDSREAPPRTMAAANRAWSGDYFRNRSLEAHLIEGVAATRWRIERAAPDAQGNPQLLSTFAFPIRAIYYIDENNGFWFAENLQSGAAQPLRSVSENELTEALKTFRASTGTVLKRRVQTLSQPALPPGHFFAFTQNAPGATEKTLGGIRWESETLHTGPVVVSQP